MAIVLVSEQVLLNLLKDVRKAELKLMRIKGGDKIIDALDWDIRALEQTTYENSGQLMAEFCKQENLIIDKAPWEE